MSKIIKNLLITIFFPIISGLILGKYIYYKYQESINKELTSSKIYLLENGEYSTYEEMREENNYHNYIYYQDDTNYKTIIGITKYSKNIPKIKELYQDNLKVVEYYLPTSLLNTKQEEYEKKILNTNDLSIIEENINNILNLYKQDDSIYLISN